MIKRRRKKSEPLSSQWATEQDCFLIENSHMPIHELMQHLPFTEDEIHERKAVLGLTTRQKQLRKWIHP